VTITALLDSERNLIGFSKITRDLSELKAAQEANRAFGRPVFRHRQDFRRRHHLDG
jgi:hypothetical protein